MDGSIFQLSFPGFIFILLPATGILASQQIVAMYISLSSRNIMELFRFLAHEITAWKRTKEDVEIDRNRHRNIEFAAG